MTNDKDLQELVMAELEWKPGIDTARRPAACLASRRWRGGSTNPDGAFAGVHR